MSWMSLTVALVAATFVFGIATIWRVRIAREWRTFPARGTGVSWILLALYTAAHTVVIERRMDPSDLLTSGLSLQNQVQAICALSIVVWAAWMLKIRTAAPRALLDGPGLWFLLLVLTYTLSASWSVWPVYTIYRCLELAAFWVIARQLFAETEWLRSTKRYVLGVVVLTAVGGVMSLILTPPQYFPGVLGLLYSNPGSTLAAGLALIGLHEFCNRPALSAAGWLFAGISMLVLFGSLAAAAMLVVTLVVFLTLRVSPWLFASVIMAGIVIATASVFFATQPGAEPMDLLNGVAGAYGKRPEHVATFSGRLDLWSALWDAAASRPFGMGFGAAERVFVVSINQYFRLGWNPTNAHSGFVSAWIGAGWFGLFILFGLIGSIAARIHSARIDLRPLGWSLLLLLCFNNMTVAGIGGPFNPPFMVAMALACCPQRPSGGS